MFGNGALGCIVPVKEVNWRLHQSWCMSACLVCLCRSSTCLFDWRDVKGASYPSCHTGSRRLKIFKDWVVGFVGTSNFARQPSHMFHWQRPRLDRRSELCSAAPLAHQTPPGQAMIQADQLSNQNTASSQRTCLQPSIFQWSSKHRPKHLSNYMYNCITYYNIL